MGHRVGDMVEWITPSGKIKLKIMNYRVNKNRRSSRVAILIDVLICTGSIRLSRGEIFGQTAIFEGESFKVAVLRQRTCHFHICKVANQLEAQPFQVTFCHDPP